MNHIQVHFAKFSQMVPPLENVTFTHPWIHSLDVEQTTEANDMKTAKSVSLCLRLLMDLFMTGHVSLYTKNVTLDRDKIDGLLQEDSQKSRTCESKAIVLRESVP